MLTTERNEAVSAEEFVEQEDLSGAGPSTETAGGNLYAAVPRLDLTQRAVLSELMDQPCSFADLRACLRDIARVNRLTSGYRPTLLWLNRLIEAVSVKTGPLRIVDVGCGYGDTLRRIAAWASKRNIPVMLTGIDLNPDAVRAAKEATASTMCIEWLTADALVYRPQDGVDIVICSLFTHHLRDHDIVRFLVWMEETARLGWFINDLHRRATHYYLFRACARVSGWHHFVRHDGPVSILRGFVLEDWQALCRAAGIALDAIAIERQRTARLCVSRIKPGH